MNSTTSESMIDNKYICCSQELLERLEGPGILEELAQEQLVDIGGGLYAKFNL